jgi:hypothetical protein
LLESEYVEGHVAPPVSVLNAIASNTYFFGHESEYTATFENDVPAVNAVP